jgi:hypothetical protein
MYSLVGGAGGGELGERAGEMGRRYGRQHSHNLISILGNYIRVSQYSDLEHEKLVVGPYQRAPRRLEAPRRWLAIMRC